MKFCSRGNTDRAANLHRGPDFRHDDDATLRPTRVTRDIESDGIARAVGSYDACVQLSVWAQLRGEATSALLEAVVAPGR